MYGNLIIASDFDGVIADSSHIEEVWKEEYIDKVFPIDWAIILLKEGVIDYIITGRKDLSWINSWLDIWVPEWSGWMISALIPGDKKRYLKEYKIDVMITDKDMWYDELLEWQRETGRVLIVYDNDNLFIKF